jgi:hypothetical protein
MQPALVLAVAAFAWSHTPAQAPEPPTEVLTEVGTTYRVTAALGDVDGDGFADLVVGRNGPFAVRMGLTDAALPRFGDERPLGPAVEPSCKNMCQPHLVDVDRDGDLDLVALDTPLGSRERVVWFANDGNGVFAAAATLRAANGEDLAWHGQARALFVADLDRDGGLDLLVAAPRIVCFMGSAQGFAHEAEDLGVATTSGMALADWNGDGRLDLLTIEDGAVVVRLHTDTGFADSTVLAAVAGDTGQAHLGIADWNRDGKPDLMLGETVANPPARDADDRQQLTTARQILALIQTERARIFRSRPPFDNAAAMARRRERLAELDLWAAGPQALVEQANAAAGPSGSTSTVRFVFGT